MSTGNVKRLHWTQRIALVQHNLHAASRGGDFTFFKAYQAEEMMGGINHFATLSATLGDDADVVMAAMDNMATGMAYTYQDAYLKIYTLIKDALRDESGKQAAKSRVYADIAAQKSKADSTIDKLCNSAIALINQQPAVDAQDQAANVFVTGVALIADCVEIVIKQLDTIDQKMDDFIRLEDSWNTVKASVTAANAGLKGVYYMLDTHETYEAPRPLSITSTGSSVFRRLSSAFQGSQSATPSSRNSSASSSGSAQQRNSVSGPPPVYRSPTSVRNSVSLGCPTSLPSPTNATFGANSFDSFDGDIFNNSFEPHKMATIHSSPLSDQECDPFDTANMESVAPIHEIYSSGPSSVAVS